MKDIVIFHLAKYAPLTPVRPYLHCAETLYEQIKSGKKTSEWRVLTLHWAKRLLDTSVLNIAFRMGDKPHDLTRYLKVHKAWFVEGYPKNNLPRLEAEITGLVYHPEKKGFPAHTQQIEIKFTNVKEVTKEP